MPDRDGSHAMKAAGALAGIRVLDLSRVLAGPWATMTLGDLGAEVTKLEHPQTGDDTRHWAPFTESDESIYFLCCNRNKRSITIDFSRPEGAALVRRLAEQSDVLVENYRNGVLRRYGLDYDTLRRVNPRLIYCSISGFGRDSPMADRPGYDVVAQAESGIMSVTGEPDGEPVKIGVPMADMVAGSNAVQAILAALLHRERSGEGQMLDIALLDGMVAMLSYLGAEHLYSGRRPRRFGNAHPAIVPYQAFDASDGRFLLAVANDHLFRLLCERVIGKPGLADDPRFARNPQRVDNRGLLVPLLAEIFAKQPAAHWIGRLEAAGIPAGRIRHVDEALAAPEVAARGLIQTLDHPTSGPVRVLGSPLKLGVTPVRSPEAAPRLGEHTDAVLIGLGLRLAEIEALRQCGVIGPQPGG